MIHINSHTDWNDLLLANRQSVWVITDQQMCKLLQSRVTDQRVNNFSLDKQGVA